MEKRQAGTAFVALAGDPACIPMPKDRGPQPVSSLESQRAACRDHCVRRGYRVVAQFQDLETGDALWEREGLSKARALIREGGADVLVLNDSFRLSRNMNHRIYLREEFEHHGCRVEYVTASEADTKEGALLQVIKDYAGDIEREKIIERATRGRHHRAMQLKVLPGGMALYGYKWGEPVPVLKEGGTPLRRADGSVVMDSHA
jgi:site-specific DNA recombinase